MKAVWIKVEKMDKGVGLSSIFLSTNVGVLVEMTALKAGNPAIGLFGEAWANSRTPCCGGDTVDDLCTKCGDLVVEELTFNLDNPETEPSSEEDKLAAIELILSLAMDPLQATLVSFPIYDIIKYFLTLGPWEGKDLLPTTPLLQAHDIITARAAAAR